MSPRLAFPRLGRKRASSETVAAAGPSQSVADQPVALEPMSLSRVSEDAAFAPSHGPAVAGPVAPAPQPAEFSVDPLAESLAKLASFPRAVLSWVEDDGYPVNVDVDIEVRLDEGIVRFSEPAGFHVKPGSVVAITGSHVRALPEGGFDQRRHVTLWGEALVRPRGRFALSPYRAWSWGEADLPMPAAYERSLPKARRYYRALSEERGEPVRPKLSKGMIFIRATRAPFLSATFVPVFLGLAVAARTGILDLMTAAITLVAACAVHLGLNVVNDVFDTIQGADDANPTPTKFSGGSRVLQNALVTIHEMSMLAAGCYGLAVVLGLVLVVLRGSPELVAIGALGFFISLAYTMPPFKLVYRGVGEISTAIGFGPVMLLGTYVVQSRGSISAEAALISVPVALLVAMILYVNEIPDRVGDAKAGKRTLPVRLSKAAVIRGFDLSAGGAFVSVTLGVVAGVLPIPTLLILLAVPLAARVHAGLVRFYDNPYGLTETMGANVRLHLLVGLLLLIAYLATMAVQTLHGPTLFLW